MPPGSHAMANSLSYSGMFSFVHKFNFLAPFELLLGIM